MKLTVLGKFGPYPAAGGGTSSYLVRSDNTNVLLDCGSAAFGRLQSFIAAGRLDAIVLSHLHSDHISDMLPLAYYLQRKGEPLDVYLPFCDCAQFEAIAAAECFNLIDIACIPKVYIGDMEVSFCEMQHSLLSYAARLYDGKSTLVYSGDTVFNDRLPSFCAGASALLLDCGKTSPAAPHMSLEEGAFLAKSCGVKAYATHLDPQFCGVVPAGIEPVKEMATYFI